VSFTRIENCESKTENGTGFLYFSTVIRSSMLLIRSLARDAGGDSRLF